MTATILCAGCQHAYIETALFCPNCGRPKVSDPPADPLPGKLLGERFLVQAPLGRGRSGTIYRAEHVTLRRKVAIKVLHTELSRDDLAVERFRREATTVAEIDNEHIVEIHDFGRTPDGRLYLAMELLEGETLDAVLARDKQLSVERAADILIQVGEALMEAHAIGYVHRDLRPRNLYLSVRRGKANFVKLLDFGLAKLVETEGQAASTSLGMTFGDPHYMSPEQARGDRIDRRADIYQLGCVAYEMLTGAPPFSGNRVFDILTKQVTEVPQPLPTGRPGVPLWMEAAVAKMLAKDPDNRFATTTRMVEALRRGLDTGEIMEDDVARRRESIPPPSVSRMMQRMGMPSPEGPAHPATQGTPGAPMAPAPAAPVLAAPAPAMARAPEPLDPSSTIQASIVPPPGKPDSVELLRKRTGTPRVGVPINDRASVVPAQAPVAQPPVAGVIDSASVPAAVPRAPASPAPSLSPAPAARSPGPEVAPGRPPAQLPARPDDDTPHLHISQAWYDEDDQLSGDQLSGDDETGARAARASKTISPSTTDLTFYGDEDRPRRRATLYAVVGVFVVIGGTMAFALTRSGSSTGPASTVPSGVPSGHDQAIAAATVDAAPSTIIPPDPPAGEVVDAAPSGPVSAGPSPSPSKASPTAHRPTATHAPVETHAPAAGRRPFDPGFPVLGSEPARRPPGPEVSTPVVTPPDPGKGPRPPSLTDSPKDPYGDEAPSDGASSEKKAEFFANLGTQQLIGGDTAGAAANFKKAIELDGKNLAAITGMGEIALRQGLFGDAIAHLSKAAKLSPRNAKVLTLLGEAYLSSGNNAQAAAQFKKALQIDPDNARARDGYNEASSRVAPPSDDSP
ncbi:MAG TPA: protein kinase [Kofleriaceae bacterium]|nr:protein kinase [Kofleriaceae bacterium]